MRPARWRSCGDDGAALAAPLFCLFSKHLPELGLERSRPRRQGRGFDGVDLTVRPQGHVLPERAAEDLPRAIDAIRAHGRRGADDHDRAHVGRLPHARPLLDAAARSGVRYFKTGYWQYRVVRTCEARRQPPAARLRNWRRSRATCGIELGFHNHAGYIGAALWDIAPAIDRLDAAMGGLLLRSAPRRRGGRRRRVEGRDAPRDAAAQDAGGQGLRLAEDGATGWRIENCPLGEGLVDWAWFGARLREARFRGPISIHLEYDIPGGAPRSARSHAGGAVVAAFARRALG